MVIEKSLLMQLVMYRWGSYHLCNYLLLHQTNISDCSTIRMKGKANQEQNVFEKKGRVN